MAAMAAGSGVIAYRHMDWEQHNVQHWIVVRGITKGSKFTTSDSYDTLNVIILSLILGIIVGLIIFAVKSGRHVNMEQDGQRLRYGSTWRKAVFGISLLLGFTGLDRIILRRYWLGCMKAFLFFYLLLELFGRSGLSGIEHMVSTVVALTIILYWWSVDSLLIHSGTVKYQTDACRYPRGSRKRKLALIVSLLAGYTGIDRLMMHRPAYGVMKFLFFIAFLGCISELARPNAESLSLALFLFFSIHTMSWWVRDIWTIYAVDTAKMHKEFLR